MKEELKKLVSEGSFSALLKLEDNSYSRWKKVQDQKEKEIQTYQASINQKVLKKYTIAKFIGNGGFP